MPQDSEKDISQGVKVFDMMDDSTSLGGDDVDNTLSSDSNLLPEKRGLLEGTLSVIRLGAGDDSFALSDAEDTLACPDTGRLLQGDAANDSLSGELTSANQSCMV